MKLPNAVQIPKLLGLAPTVSSKYWKVSFLAKDLKKRFFLNKVHLVPYESLKMPEKALLTTTLLILSL